MRDLIIILLFFLLSGSTCDNVPDGGFDEEPAFLIVFHDGNQNFVTQSASINKSKKPVLENDLPGVDMSATSVKFWISRGTTVDSFVVCYKLLAGFGRKKTLLNFDTIYYRESSFSNSEFISEHDLPDSFKDYKRLRSFVSYPVFYIK